MRNPCFLICLILYTSGVSYGQDSLNAFFTAEPRTGYIPLTVQFLDASTGNVDGYYWDFGDGYTGIKANPVHTYNQADSFTVRLTVSNDQGSDTQIRTHYIIALDPAPVAAYTALPRSGNVPLIVQFTNQSSGDIDSLLWNFGDGSTGFEANPAHEYLQTGIYTVSLTVAGPGGIDTRTRSDYITVLPPLPVAGFSASPLNGTVPLSVQFTDQSTGEIDARYWDFGDGAGSDSTNPVHVYTMPDTLNVTLIVSGPGGADTLQQQDLITTRFPTEIEQDKAPVALNFGLEQNYPNPFNPETTISYTVTAYEHVKLTVFNTLGEEIFTLIDKMQRPGQYKVQFNAIHLPSGIYFYRLRTESGTILKQMLLLR